MIDPAKQYLAVMHYWLWRPVFVATTNGKFTQEALQIRSFFTYQTVQRNGRVVTDLEEGARFAITLANGMERVDPEREIKLEVFELTNPILVV
jgi:hypothetical protein